MILFLLYQHPHHLSVKTLIMSIFTLDAAFLAIAEFYDRVDGDLSMGFGGLAGRGAKKQDTPIERDLFLSLEEVYHGCTKKMKISRRV